MTGLYICAKADAIGAFEGSWNHPTVPVYWRVNDLEVRTDGLRMKTFLRNSWLPGREQIMAYGAGQGASERSLFGMLEIVAFTLRDGGGEDDLLQLLSDAMAAIRSKRVAGTYPPTAQLSFMAEGTHFIPDDPEDGLWFSRGVTASWEYRFRG